MIKFSRLIMATGLCLIMFSGTVRAQNSPATVSSTPGTAAKNQPSKGAAPNATTTKESYGPWLVRLRLLSMSNADRSEPFTAAHVNFPANAVSVADKVFPEADVSYFWTKRFSSELILTYPQDHAVDVAGLGRIGTIRHLPPTLTFLYHVPAPRTRLTPYIGAGVNFTWVTGANLIAAGIPLDVTRTSVGLALQVGVDYDLGKHWSLNFDYKHFNLNPDVFVTGTNTKVTNAEIDPDLIGFGVGYRF